MQCFCWLARDKHRPCISPRNVEREYGPISIRTGRRWLVCSSVAYVAGTSLPDTWGPLVSIDRFVPSETFRSSGVSLAMGTEIWDRARSVTAHDDGMVVGWYHSHPNLGAFFSSTDRATQRAFFNQPYSVGLVVDPIRGEKAWFIGADSASLRGESVLRTGPTLPCGDPPQRSSKD